MPRWIRKRMQFVHPIWIFVTVFGLLLTACGGTPTTSQSRTVDGVTITLQRPATSKIFADQELQVTLKNAAGQPIDEADVYIDLSMPTDNMGMNRPVAEPVGNGTYRVRSAFSMLGGWVMKVVAAVDGREYRASFDTEVVE